MVSLCSVSRAAAVTDHRVADRLRKRSAWLRDPSGNSCSTRFRLNTMTAHGGDHGEESRDEPAPPPSRPAPSRPAPTVAPVPTSTGGPAGAGELSRGVRPAYPPQPSYPARTAVSVAATPAAALRLSATPPGGPIGIRRTAAGLSRRPVRPVPGLSGQPGPGQSVSDQRARHRVADHLDRGIGSAFRWPSSAISGYCSPIVGMVLGIVVAHPGQSDPSAGSRARHRRDRVGSVTATLLLLIMIAVPAALQPHASGADRRHPVGGTNRRTSRSIPAARPFAAITSAILRLASSSISSPSIAAPRAPPAADVCHS